MADIFTKHKRSWIMSRVHGKDTEPERRVRSALHRMGYRYRLHRKGLPGKPDIVLTRHKAIIFVHGCFWHSHQECSRARRPTTNIEFWDSKINATIRRDILVGERLREMGWKTLVVWQCETKRREYLETKLRSYLLLG